MSENDLGILPKLDVETFPFTVLFTDWLGGETIATAEAKAYDGTTDVSTTVLGTVSHGPETVRVWVKAGTAGENYRIRIKITDTADKVWAGEVSLMVLTPMHV